MSEPFIGEVRPMSFGFAPKGWALCNGQLLTINQNQALFSLLGTTYGGDGRTNFALPNLQGNAPVHVGGGLTQGQRGGEVSHTLTVAEVPPHSHAVPASTTLAPDANTDPTNSVVATTNANVYAPFTQPNAVAMNASVIATAGGGTAHENRQPYLAVNFCIALQGIFPSRN
jgi:microcystin-dependent protein